MAAQQSSFPGESNLALDRLYAKLTNYADTRIEALIVQMRIDRQEAQIRDDILLKRLENIEDGLRGIVDIVMSLAQQVGSLSQRISNVEAQQETTMQLMRDLHAEAMEAINELRRKGNE